jgi:hypothetical protein
MKIIKNTKYEYHNPKGTGQQTYGYPAGVSDFMLRILAVGAASHRPASFRAER